MAVAGQINIEFRRVDKFTAVSGGSGLYVTDSWIIKSTTYRIHVAQQTDSHLSIAGNLKELCQAGDWFREQSLDEGKELESRLFELIA